MIVLKNSINDVTKTSIDYFYNILQEEVKHHDTKRHFTY
jgi:hypothetical protein